MNSVSRDKVINAFKGVVGTHKLSPPTEESLVGDSEFVSSWEFFETESSLLVLSFRQRDLERLINLVGRLFPDQTDSKLVTRFLKQAHTEIIEQGYDLNDQGLLEQVAADFLNKVEQEIKDFVGYVPIEGIKVDSIQHLPVARCHLYTNRSNSELMEAVRQSRERASLESERFDKHYLPIEQASAFFKVEVSGHSNRAIQRCAEEANIALDVLRLFLKSFYFHEYKAQSVPKCMGIVGTLPATGPHSNIFLVRAGSSPIAQRDLITSGQIKHHDHFELNDRVIENLRNNSILIHINQLLNSLQSGSKIDVGGRLLRAVNWFGKASQADSVAESFLMYAISVESF
jgi:hypothetical protein